MALLIDISGPFLSVEVLTKALPQGLDKRGIPASTRLPICAPPTQNGVRSSCVQGPTLPFTALWVDFVLNRCARTARSA